MINICMNGQTFKIAEWDYEYTWSVLPVNKRRLTRKKRKLLAWKRRHRLYTLTKMENRQ